MLAKIGSLEPPVPSTEPEFLQDSTYLVYDGECPFCSAYVRFVRLQETVGKVELLDARQGGEVVDYLTSQNFDLDEGMALIYKDRIYHGDECINILALLSSKSSLFNRINYVIFQNKRVAAFLYPIMRAGRNLVLKLLGKTKLNP
jgi:predicted DCC family thiol-disulfide oxidoreductase YuxK